MRPSSLFSLLGAGALARAAAVPTDGKVDYAGFLGLRLTFADHTPELDDQLTSLVAHVLNPGAVDKVDVVVSPANVEAVQALATTSEVIVEDFGVALEEEAGEAGALTTRAVPPESWFTSYHPYNDHLQFLRDLQGGFTTNSEIITAGSSVNGRVITGIHIWGSGGKGSKPAVLFHGTVHAREWISTLTTQYQAWQLLTKYSSDATVKALVDKYDFYIFPIVNPDGFVYTQTSDRLWRKNRQTVSGNSCVGRDINRNWPFEWARTGGASTNPCSETYKGQAAGDAPENRGLVAQANALRNSRGIALYIDFHSYGQYILWPYGYDCNLVSPFEAAHQTLAVRAQSAIRAVSGTAYTVGNSCRHLYATTGSSVDYLKGAANATYGFTIELRDRGASGFVLPANQIQPTVRETWAGVVSLVQNV